MKPKDNLILTELEPTPITVLNDINVDALFNLSYNFDLLKGTITTMINNQQILQNQCIIENKTNNEQNQTLESLQRQVQTIDDNYINKDTFKEHTDEIKEIQGKIQSQNELLQKSKLFKFYLKIYI